MYPARILFVRQEWVKQAIHSSIEFSGEKIRELVEGWLECDIDQHFTERSIIECTIDMYNGGEDRQRALDLIFGQHQDCPNHRSMMIGDVVEYPLDQGQYYVCSPIGWQEIQLELPEHQDR